MPGGEFFIRRISEGAGGPPERETRRRLDADDDEKERGPRKPGRTQRRRDAVARPARRAREGDHSA